MEFSDVESDITEVLITEQEILDKLAELARRIEVDYANEKPLLVGVLRGAVMVMADLARELRIPIEMDWMAVSSYGSGTQSSGVVRILKDLDTDLHGRKVIIVEDIIDSGLTLSWLRSNLENRGADSVEICALLRKPDAATVDVDVKYQGFEIPNKFVIGYGLDYAEQYRNLRGIAVLAPHVYS
jgi:hypoxanthine phosphoribosyltransferase